MYACVTCMGPIRCALGAWLWNDKHHPNALWLLSRPHRFGVGGEVWVCCRATSSEQRSFKYGPT